MTWNPRNTDTEAAVAVVPAGAVPAPPPRCPACGTTGVLDARGVMGAHRGWASGFICWAAGFEAARVISGGFFWLMPASPGARPVARSGVPAELVVERGTLVAYGTPGAVPLELCAGPSAEVDAAVAGQTRWWAADPWGITFSADKLISQDGFLRIAGPFRLDDEGPVAVVCDGCDWRGDPRADGDDPGLAVDATAHRCPGMDDDHLEAVVLTAKAARPE